MILLKIFCHFKLILWIKWVESALNTLYSIFYINTLYSTSCMYIQYEITIHFSVCMDVVKMYFWKLLRCMMRTDWLFVVEIILQGVRHYQYLLSLSVYHIHQWHEKINNGNSFAEEWKWKALPDKYRVNAIFSVSVYSFSIFWYIYMCILWWKNHLHVKNVNKLFTLVVWKMW